MQGSPDVVLLLTVVLQVFESEGAKLLLAQEVQLPLHIRPMASWAWLRPIFSGILLCRPNAAEDTLRVDQQAVGRTGLNLQSAKRAHDDM